MIVVEGLAKLCKRPHGAAPYGMHGEAPKIWPALCKGHPCCAYPGQGILQHKWHAGLCSIAGWNSLKSAAAWGRRQEPRASSAL